MVKTQYININNINYELLIGKNSLENSELVKYYQDIGNGNGNVIWFHLENKSSAHMFFNTMGHCFSKKQLKQVALKLLNNCKSKGLDNVIYTAIENVKLTNTPGLVETSSTKVIKFV